MKILIVWYSALSDKIVVIDPAPAISGNAIGKIDPPPWDSVLKSSIPKIISMAIRKIMKDPAIANEETSIPNIPSNGLPMNKNARSIKKETRVTFVGFMSPDLAFISIIMGIDPGISMIANKTIKAARISIRLKCMELIFLQRYTISAVFVSVAICSTGSGRDVACNVPTKIDLENCYYKKPQVLSLPGVQNITKSGFTELKSFHLQGF